MDDPSVRCGACGTPIEEPPDTKPEERQPCPKCGSRSRTIRVSASDELRQIGEAYAEATAASNRRIRRLTSAQAAAAKTRSGSFTADAVIANAGLAEGTGTAHGPGARTESAIAAEIDAERGHLIQAAVQTLIDTVRVGQAESARAAEQLNGLTVELVKWTRVIGTLTIVTVVVALAALLVAVYAAFK